MVTSLWPRFLAHPVCTLVIVFEHTVQEIKRHHDFADVW